MKALDNQLKQAQEHGKEAKENTAHNSLHERILFCMKSKMPHVLCFNKEWASFKRPKWPLKLNKILRFEILFHLWEQEAKINIPTLIELPKVPKNLIS